MTLRSFAATGALALSVLLAGCGAGSSLDDSSSSSSSSSSASSASTSASACSAKFPVKSPSYSKSKNAGNPQCTTLIDGAESYRQAAIANCQAGDSAAATTYYGYYGKTYPLLSSVCI